MADSRSHRRAISRDRSRIDQPLEQRRSLRVTVDPETVGKLSERIARFLGSWRFIGYMTAFVLTWYQEDRADTDRLIADTDYLAREMAALRLGLGEVTTRDFMRSELRELLTHLNDDHADDDAERSETWHRWHV